MTGLDILLLILLLIAAAAAVGLLLALRRSREQVLRAYAARAEATAVREALEARLQRGLRVP